MRILLFTGVYPTTGNPGQGSFVQSLVRELVNNGVGVTVVHMIPLHNFLFRLGSLRKLENAINYKRLLLPYISFSHNRFFGLQMMNLTFKSLQVSLSIMVRLKKFDSIDFCYGKFLSEGGVAARWASSYLKVNYVLDLGESYSLLKYRQNALLRMVALEANCVFCVSDRLKDEMISLGSNPSVIYLSPNTTDAARFRKMDKTKCRKELGLDSFVNSKIVAFVGHFNERKGPLRLLEALELSNGEFVGVFLGKGNLNIEGNSVVHSGLVPNHDLPKWLNACDIFVLPSLGEGCCNAVEEAIACGLPVAVSNITDFKTQLVGREAEFFDPFDAKDVLIKMRKALNVPVDVGSRIGESRGELILRVLSKSPV
jgi:glycosyltransferase involved in cell wall biosynthesis